MLEDEEDYTRHVDSRKQADKDKVQRHVTVCHQQLEKVRRQMAVKGAVQPVRPSDAFKQEKAELRVEQQEKMTSEIAKNINPLVGDTRSHLITTVKDVYHKHLVERQRLLMNEMEKVSNCYNNIHAQLDTMMNGIRETYPNEGNMITDQLMCSGRH